MVETLVQVKEGLNSENRLPRMLSTCCRLVVMDMLGGSEEQPNLCDLSERKRIVKQLLHLT